MAIDSSTSSSSSSYTPVSYYIAIGVVSFALCELGVFLVVVLRLRKAHKRVAASIAATNDGTHQRSSGKSVTLDDLRPSMAYLNISSS